MKTHSTSMIVASLFAVGLAALPASLVNAAAAPGPEVVIEGNAVIPGLLVTTPEQRVTFINRSGRPVHLEFYPTPHGHQVFQVPGQIWATFHIPGRHPYVVHIERGDRVVTLVGAVEVREGSRSAGPPVCNGATVLAEQGEVCVER